MKICVRLDSGMIIKMIKGDNQIRKCCSKRIEKILRFGRAEFLECYVWRERERGDQNTKRMEVFQVQWNQ